ncbi:uncharacterized protein [Primulina eburnea]|uniref:uncharacterized protein n=1 Tax=Primulina eburnea TaxID=1245227 RepID=UPI003C6BE9FD
MDEVPAPTDRDGVPGIFFPDQVISSLSAHFRFALIGRISGNRGLTPNKDILSALSCTGLLGSHTVRFLPRGYMVLTLSCEEDYLKFWERPDITIRTVVIRFSKWTPEFKYEEDSSIAPVWVRFPDLPLHLYAKKSLYPIAMILGNPVMVDEITADVSRGSFARVCVEMDVLQPRPDKIWVGWGDHFQVVEVIYERVPRFCSKCKMLGHSLDFCSSTGLRFGTRRRGPQRQAPPAPPSADPMAQGPRPHGKDVVSDSPLQTLSVSTQGISSDLVQSGDTDFPEQLVTRSRRRPVVRRDPNRPISTKNYYEVLEHLPSESGPGESSGIVNTRIRRVKSLLSKIAVEETVEAAVSVPVAVPVQMVEIAPIVPDPLGDSSASITLPVDSHVSTDCPEFAMSTVSVDGVTDVVTSSMQECLSLPLPGRTRSQQRRYYRQKSAQASSPYERPHDPG